MIVLPLLFMLFGPLLIALLAHHLGKAFLYVAIAALVLFTTLVAGKLVPITDELVLSAGTPLYAAIFLCTDMLAEFYGAREARIGVAVGLVVNALFLLLGAVTMTLPSIEGPIPAALEAIFNFGPWLVGGGMTAYVVAQIFDVYVFERLKTMHGRRLLWLRNNLSTMLSQLIDTVIVYCIAFWASGVISDIAVLGGLILTNWIAKLVVAAIDTPFIYAARWLHERRSHG